MRTPFDRPVPLYIVYFVITLIMVGILLSWQAWKRTANFRQFHEQLATTSVSGAADEIEIFLTELNRSIRLFAIDQLALFDSIAADPDNDQLWLQLEHEVNSHFPEHFGITLTDSSGTELRVDFEFLVSDVCREDIRTFIGQGFWLPRYIHPNPLGYHFDMMVPWGRPERPQGVFFLSFSPDILAQVLKRMQTPGHELILLDRERPGLIEVTAQGGRDQLRREFTLDSGEIERIAYSFPVSDTRWDLIDLPSPKLFHKEARRNWIYAGAVFAVFMAVGMVMILQIRRVERRRLLAEEQAAKHRADLAHVDRLNTMGEMASGLAHELNQPLSAISTYAQAGLRLINNPDAQPDKLAHALEQTSVQAKRAGEIIHRMRQFATKSSPRHKSLDLNEVVRRATAFVESELGKKRIRQHFDLGKGLPPVKGDSIQIEQVILNLIQNAIDAMTSSNTPRKQIGISTRMNESGNVETRIVDTGPGFDSHVMEKVFDTFYSTKEDGMGLGLSISRSIIEAHGGRLWCVSTPGSGTTCYFTLPARRH